VFVLGVASLSLPPPNPNAISTVLPILQACDIMTENATTAAEENVTATPDPCGFLITSATYRGVTTDDWSSTRNPKPETRNPKPGTLNPQPSTLNPRPSTLDPRPSTLNPTPRTPIPQPCTLNLEP